MFAHAVIDTDGMLKPYFLAIHKSFNYVSCVSIIAATKITQAGLKQANIFTVLTFSLHNILYQTAMRLKVPFLLTEWP